jgi:hypothetical protein
LEADQILAPLPGRGVFEGTPSRDWFAQLTCQGGKLVPTLSLSIPFFFFFLYKLLLVSCFIYLFIFLNFIYFCMSRRYRDNLGRFAKEPDTDSSDSEAYFPNLFDSPIASDTLSLTSSHTMGDHEEDQPIKTLHDYLHPTRNSSPSCIMFPANQQNFDFKPRMIPLLPTFHGMDNENPYVHIREFEEVVATFHSQLGSIDTVRLKFFPFSLKDKAKSWLYS